MFRRGVPLLAAALLASMVVRAEELSDQLWVAARKGDAAAVKALLAKGLDVNTKFRYDTTALWWAAFKGHTEVVRVLLEHGADVNIKETSGGITPLQWAAFQGSAEIIKMLLEKGAQGAETALEWAAMRGQVEAVKLLLAQPGIKPDALSAALAAAEKSGKAELVELLKKSGAKQIGATESVQLDAATLARYAGVYKNPQGMEFAFSVKDGKLTGGNIFDDPVTWQPVDKTTFASFGFGKATAAFKLEGDRVVGFTMKQGSAGEFVFRKVEK